MAGGVRPTETNQIAESTEKWKDKPKFEGALVIEMHPQKQRSKTKEQRNQEIEPKNHRRGKSKPQNRRGTGKFDPRSACRRSSYIS
jgi:hypothetical protein